MSLVLPIPKEITALIEEGFWPRDMDSALSQNLHSIVSEQIVREFAPEETRVFFLPPSYFNSVGKLMQTSEKNYWSDPRTAVAELDPDLTLVIGDFGLGSDAPIALDYRRSMNEPSVIRLRWAKEGNHWIEVAPTFAIFASRIRKQTV